jgi:hypothetical protein
MTTDAIKLMDLLRWAVTKYVYLTIYSAYYFALYEWTWRSAAGAQIDTESGIFQNSQNNGERLRLAGEGVILQE